MVSYTWLVLFVHHMNRMEGAEAGAHRLQFAADPVGFALRKDGW